MMRLRNINDKQNEIHNKHLIYSWVNPNTTVKSVGLILQPNVEDSPSLDKLLRKFNLRVDTHLNSKGYKTWQSIYLLQLLGRYPLKF